MSLTDSRDIAPEFKSLLAGLSANVLQEIENSFIEGLSKKTNVTKADQAILQSLQDEHSKRKLKQNRTVFLPETKKCLHCNTYHSLDKQHCPECGRYLYACGCTYQPKVRRKVTV